MTEETTAHGPQKVGFIDLGTNSVRLLIVRVARNGAWTALFKHREMIRLGEGAYTSGELNPVAMDRTVAALTVIAGICEDFRVEKIVAVATAATRDAANGEVFTERVRRETGIDLNIISGREEARLIYTGVSAGVPLGTRSALFIDIGGGSTEVSLGNSVGYRFLDSLNCGCVRYSNRFISPGDTGPVSAKTFRDMCAAVRDGSQRAIEYLSGERIDLAVGSSGTIENLAVIALRMKDPDLRMDALLPENRMLRYDELADMAKQLCDLPLEKRRQVPGMNPRRAEVIVAGAAIIQTLMKELGLKEILVSERGLQHGLLIDFMRTSHLGFPDQSMPVREVSVRKLVKLCNAQETHGEHVACLALQIFDSAEALKLFCPEQGERELLYYTALLHDIGMALSLKNHHAHGHYFIRNAEMAGFFNREIDIMAGGVYCHGKQSDAKKYGENLPDSIRDTVRRNGAILRLCEALDRSHRSRISRVELTMKKGKKYALALEGASKEICSVELAALKDGPSLLQTAFGQQFSLRFNETEVSEDTA